MLINEHTPQIKSVFMDKSAMKEKVKASLDKPVYDVKNFYHTTGRAQWIARHPVFENLTLFVISLNAIWLWIDTDYNTEADPVKVEWYFVIVENLFCLYFSFE